MRNVDLDFDSSAHRVATPIVRVTREAGVALRRRPPLLDRGQDRLALGRAARVGRAPGSARS